MHDNGRVLTPQQTTIVKMIAEGYTTKQIAQILNLSPKTIESHRATAMQIIGAMNIAGLVRYAMRAGLVTALLLVVSPGLSRADTLYGKDGRVIGRTTTDSKGTTTTYGADGRAVTRESPNTGGSTVYDARSGQVYGKITKERK